MSMPVGSVHVDVVPSTRDFVKDMRKQLLDEADKVGKEMGERIGRDIAEKLTKPVSDGIEEGVEKSRPEKSADKAGRKAGSAFSRAFEREVRSAITSLPDINLDVETDEARRRIGELRRELNDFFDDDGNLKLDVANEEGLAHIREIREELRTLRDEDVQLEVEYDIDEAIENLGKLERAARDHGQRAGDNFGKGLRSALDSAMRALPDIDVGINLDDDGGMAQLQTLFRQLEGLRDLEIGVDIREDQAIEGMRAILDQLETIAQNDVEFSVRVRDDATASATALRGFLDRLFPEQETIDYFIEMETEPAQREVGAFATQLQREIGGAITALPDIDLDMDSSEAEFRIAAVRRELQALSDLRIGVDIDADEAFARMREIKTRLEEVRDLAGARNQYALDTSTAVAAMRSLADATGEVETRGAGAHRVLNRFQEIALLITLAFTPAAAAVLALAAAGLAVVAPIAAVIAGVDGIVAAFAPLADELADLRSAVSDAFEQGLVPAVSSAARLMPTLTAGLAGLATSLSVVASEMLGVAAEGENVAQLNTIFNQMNTAVAGLGAPMGNLVDNVLEFADIGSSALGTLGPLLDQVGFAWDRVLEAFRQTGAGEAAVVALVQALTAILTLAAPLVQLGASMFAVLGPALAAVLNGAAEAVFFLANAFDALPGPLQAALAAALLLRIALGLTGRTVADLMQSLARLGGNAATSIAAPFTAAAGSVRDFRGTLDEAGRSTAGWSQATQQAGARVTSALDGVAQRMRTAIPDAAEAAGRALSEGLARGADTAARAFDRLPDSAARSATKVAQAVRGAPVAALTAMEKGVNRAVDGFVSGWARAEQATVNAGRAILSGWVAAENGLVNGAAAVGRAWDGAGNLLVGAGQRIAQGWRVAEQSLVTGAAAVGRAWDGAGSAFVNSVKAIDAGVNTVMTRFQELPQIVGDAARRTSASVAEGFRGMEERVRALPDAFRAMGTTVGNALSTIPTAIGRMGTAVQTGLLRVATVAEGAGRAIGAGLGRAVLGITDALGGVWGIVITAAVAALSLFGAAQADAAAKSAEFKTQVETTAQAIRESGGAITQNMRETELLSLVQAGVSESARVLGMNLAQLSETAIGGGAAWDQLRTQLENTARAGSNMSLLSQEMGFVMTESNQAIIEQGLAAQGLLDALGPLAEKYKQAAAENRIFQELVRQSNVSMVGGVDQAAQLAEAFGTLGDEMATTADRATALYEAMLLLTGGTLPAEQALASMRNAIADIGTAFQEAAVGANEAGMSILDASGNINQATKQGRDLVLKLDDVGRTALTAATSVFEAAGGMQNLAAASAAAGNVIREQRQNFIAVATAAGVGGDAAEDYANRLGLIPELVETLLRMEGLPQVQQELLQLQGLIDMASEGTIVPIDVSGEAIAILDQIGVKIVDLPEGKVGILVDDQTAPQIQGILAAIEQSRAIMPVGGDIAPVTGAADQARKNVAGQAAQLPIQADGTPVPPAVGELRNQVGGTAAQLPITPNDQVSPLIGKLRTDAQTPINMTLTVTDQATVAINNIRGTATAALAMTLTVNDQATVTINNIRGTATAATTMPITARDDGASGTIESLRRTATAGASMPIDADDQAARGVIRDLADAASQEVTMPIDLDTALAKNSLSALARDIRGTRASVVVEADTKTAVSAIDELKKPTSSTHTVHINVVGQMPRAMGGIVPANFSMFANGGVHNGRLTPMPANKARIVQPNTFRVIGDRARDAEAYIPINQAPRSQRLLKITAAQMGWGLHPLTAMASGGVLSTRREDLISTQSTGSFQSSVSSPVGGTVSARGVEQRLDQIAGLLAATPRQPTSITVEDRSGDPVQTARATQLALRLARH